MDPFGVRPEYLELVDPNTLEPIEFLARPALLVIAARIGEVRLIDNVCSRPGRRRSPVTPVRAVASRPPAH